MEELPEGGGATRACFHGSREKVRRGKCSPVVKVLQCEER